MSFKIVNKSRLFLLASFVVSLASCAIGAPVQEMSNARQSIQAAKDADAENYARALLSEASQRLNSAKRELDAGEYERARELAIEAKQLASKARQVAIAKKVK